MASKGTQRLLMREKSAAYKATNGETEYIGTIDYISKKTKTTVPTIMNAIVRNCANKGFRFERIGYYVPTYKVYEKKWKYSGKKNLLEIEEMGIDRQYLGYLLREKNGEFWEMKFKKQKKKELVYDKIDG